MLDPGDFVTDYALAIPPMEKLGWQVVEVPWRSPDVDWNDFDAVYICTPWDYPDHVDEFLAVLESIERSKAVLVNPLTLVRWTLRKSYLRDLEARGAAIVPSSWQHGFDAAVVNQCFAGFGTDKLVIKPLVGANAADTYVLSRPLEGAVIEKLASVFRGRDCFVQPFIDSVETEGEFSLFYFGGDYSHAILKTPQAGDFRVQEEHGADIAAVTAAAELVDTATRVIALVEPQPLYARADFLRDARGRFLLMELEIIEPSLYLRMDESAPMRFARAFDRYVRTPPF